MVSWTHPEKAVSRLNSDALVTQLPSSSLGTGIVVRGYPVEKNAQMWSMSGSIAASGTFKLSYYIDTTGGQSGSPVYKNDGNYRCVGIHTNYNSLGYNQAERIDESLFDIMNQYR